MNAVNHIDLTGIDMLIELNQELKVAQKTLHLTEVKGPVMDNLVNSSILAQLTGQVFLSTHQATQTLITKFSKNS